MSSAALAKRLLAAALPDRALRPLRTAWHRAQALDPRRIALRRRFLRLNRDAGRDEVVLRPGLRLGVDPRSVEPFEWFCFRSPEMVREFDEFLARSRDLRRFLDVGAFHGLFALAFCRRPGTRAVAVEPSPLAWEVLESNLRLNPGADVTPVRAAVGAAPGVLAMRYAWHHLEASPAGEDAPDAVRVPLRTLDDLAAELGFHPDAMKVDVEGYEMAVLQGARRILREDRPVLFLEVHPQRLRELGSSMEEISRLLAEPGYRVFDLAGAPLPPGRLAAVASVSRFRCEPIPRA